MRPFTGMRALAAGAALFSMIPTGVFGADVLSTTGFNTCLDDSEIKVDKLDISYNKNTRKLTFNVAGESKSAQNVTANLVVTAYGKEVYSKEFSPCDEGMTEMCPVPAAKFASQGEQTVPEEFAKQIPSIAFSVPDLDGQAKMYLTRDDDKTQLACVESTVGNGKTMDIPAAKYVAAGIAAASLALTGLSALSAAGTPGATSPSPSFGEVFGWFQSMALSGMMSVKYPTVYQSFSSNFAFSTGLIPWDSMQNSIDNFRQATGGNLTENNYNYLKNATLVFSNGANSSEAGSLKKRAIEGAFIFLRDGTSVSVNGETTDVGGGNSDDSSSDDAGSTNQKYVKDIQAYVEQLQIPAPNTFMTMLLIFAIVVAAIIVLILLFKVILEAWSMVKPLSHSMESWRKRYWWRLAKAITNLVMLLYGIWTLYCIYQFTNGDSWAAKTLAGVTLALFTALLGWFSFQIWSKAREAKKQLGDASNLYEDKEVWVRYSLFYDNYKKSYWWIFMPVIVYMFVRGCVIAGAQSNGLVQTAGQLIVESLMLCLLLWTRPFSLKSSNIINCVIQTVRVLSVICILVFVEELGISNTTKTVTGVVLIVVQSVLTGVLAILIAVNALIFCIKKNPHRQARKEAEKEKELARDLDNLTPLDARNSLLMEPMSQKGTTYKAPIVSDSPFGAGRDTKGQYDPVPHRPESPSGDSHYGRSLSRPSEHYRDHSSEGLVRGAAEMGYRDQSNDRQPRLPDLYGYGQAR